MDSLRSDGYETYSAIDNDAPSFRFVEDIVAYGHADKPISLEGLRVRQYDFDGTPIYDDLEVLNRWWDIRNRSEANRAALYVDLTTLHGGAHWADDSSWWTKNQADLYGEFARHLFMNLDTFFKTLSESGRNFVVVFIPEHGMALRGSSIQSSDVRDIPLPQITTVPAAFKIIGKDIPFLPERQVTVSKPVSYLALSYILNSALSAPAFDRESILTREVIDGIPETKFVAENEASKVVKKDGDVFYFGKDKKWIKLPPSAFR